MTMILQSTDLSEIMPALCQDHWNQRRPDLPCPDCCITESAEECWESSPREARAEAESRANKIRCSLMGRTDQVFLEAALEWQRVVRTATGTVLHPLVPLVQAWQKWQGELSHLNPHNSNLILPGTLGTVASTDRRAKKLFTGVCYGQGSLPGILGIGDTLIPAFPLVLYDMGFKTHNGGGRGAPLSLRIFVEALTATPQEKRHGKCPIALEVSLRELLQRLYCANRRPRPSEYWPALKRAFNLINSMEAAVDLGNGARNVVLISQMPRGPEMMDDIIRVIVDLPLHSENGPPVPDSLGWWGLRSAPAYRALLNLSYIWYEPGRTRYPITKKKGKNGEQFWLTKYDPSNYPPLTEDELIRLCFPTSDRRSKRNALFRSKQIIRDLAAEPPAPKSGNPSPAHPIFPALQIIGDLERPPYHIIPFRPPRKADQDSDQD